MKQKITPLGIVITLIFTASIVTYAVDKLTPKLVPIKLTVIGDKPVGHKIVITGESGALKDAGVVLNGAFQDSVFQLTFESFQGDIVKVAFKDSGDDCKVDKSIKYFMKVEGLEYWNSVKGVDYRGCSITVH